jgi:hypothetical protein
VGYKELLKATPFYYRFMGRLIRKKIAKNRRNLPLHRKNELTESLSGEEGKERGGEGCGV